MHPILHICKNRVQKYNISLFLPNVFYIFFAFAVSYLFMTMGKV